MRRRPAALALIVGLVTLPAQAAWVGKTRGKDRVEEWNSELRKADDLLAGGEAQEAERVSVHLLKDMTRHLERGKPAGQALAAALLRRGLADAALGRTEDALWYWDMAMALHPEFKGLDLASYGEPGTLLMDNVGSCKEPRSGSHAEGTPDENGHHLEPPKVKRKRRPIFTDGARSAHVQGTLVLGIVINTDGSIRCPRIVEPIDAPALVYNALEAMRTWEFTSAQLDGEPVAAYYNLTVNYTFGRR